VPTPFARHGDRLFFSAGTRVESGLRRTARELLMQKYNAGKKGGDFNRPLVYPPSGIV